MMPTDKDRGEPERWPNMSRIEILLRVSSPMCPVISRCCTLVRRNQCWRKVVNLLGNL